MDNKSLYIKLKKDEMVNSIEAIKNKNNREPTQEELHNIIYYTCNQLILVPNIKLDFELYLKDIEKLDSEYSKYVKGYLIKRKTVIDDMIEEIMKL